MTRRLQASIGGATREEGIPRAGLDHVHRHVDLVSPVAPSGLVVVVDLLPYQLIEPLTIISAFTGAHIPPIPTTSHFNLLIINDIKMKILISGRFERG
jgi:hypothetical protein